MFQELLQSKVARRRLVEPTEQQVLRDLEELAVKCQFGKEAHVGSDERAEQGRPAQRVDPHDAVLRVAEAERVPQLPEAHRRTVLHQVQAGVVARQPLTVGADEARLRVHEDDGFVSCDHGHALLEQTRCGQVVGRRPFEERGRRAIDQQVEVPDDADVRRLAHIANAAIPRGVCPADGFGIVS